MKAEERAPLLYAYRRLYLYLAQLTLVPRYLQRKGQSAAEAYVEFEAANLDLLHVHLHDLKCVSCVCLAGDVGSDSTGPSVID